MNVPEVIVTNLLKKVLSLKKMKLILLPLCYLSTEFYLSALQFSFSEKKLIIWRN